MREQFFYEKTSSFDGAAKKKGEEMCFRPPGIEQSIKCPDCGKKVGAVMGQIPEICPFCEANLKDVIAAMTGASVMASGAHPVAPVAPKAPVVFKNPK